VESLHALLAGTLDYAGLFPPASLSMPDAAANYARYRSGEHAWLLGRFVVPARRIGELGGVPWSMAALVKWNGTGIETSLDDSALRAVFVEIPIEHTESLADLARAGLRVKIRTGGVTSDAFPSSAQVAAFLAACNRAGAAFKATAGLHHPLRCERPLTYDAGSPLATMHGFLNLFLAAAFVREGMGEDEALALLEERLPEAFRFEDGGVTWRRRRLTTARLRESRERFAMAFGSCSFEEPVAELRELGLL
jgi:hypothetical protein